MTSKKKLLILISGGLGDFIFNIPALNILASHQPKVEIHCLYYTSFNLEYLTKVKTRSISSSPWINLISNKVKNVEDLNSLSLWQIFKVRKKIVREGFDEALILTSPHVTKKSLLKKRIFLYLMGLKISARIISKNEVKLLDEIKMHKAIGPISIVKKYLNQDYIYGSNSYSIDLQNFISQNENKMKVYKKINIKEKSIIFFPGSNFDFKNWGLKNFIDLSDQILKKYFDVKKIFIAGPAGDDYLIKSFKNPNVISLCGIDFNKLCEFIHCSSCVIGNDGGGVQLSGYLGSPTIVLSNGSEPGLVTPMGAKIIELRKSTACSPCFSYTSCPLNNPVCVRDISTKQVLSSLDKIIQ